MRFFLWVGKYTPNDAVAGEMAWVPPHVRQWKSVVGYWARLSDIPESRVNKRVALWANSNRKAFCKSWFCNIRPVRQEFSVVQPQITTTGSMFNKSILSAL